MRFEQEDFIIGKACGLPYSKVGAAAPFPDLSAHGLITTTTFKWPACSKVGVCHLPYSRVVVCDLPYSKVVVP